MKQRKMLVPFLASFAVLAACEGSPDRLPLAPDAPLEARQDAILEKMVPFKGSGTWQAVAFSEPDFENMEIEITVETEGTATHLGRFESVWTARYSFILVNGDLIPTEYLSHSTIYTAANGDELYTGGCVDKGTEYFPEEDGLSFFMTGVSIVGGTGRFEGAEGYYDFLVKATEGLPFPGGTWELEGEISTVGSTRGGR